MSTLVIIPTYDERESLPGTLERLRTAQPDVDVLVVDDASPDGTGRWAEEVAARDPRVHVLHRTGKGGLGAAYVAGFGWGLGRGYDVLCEMDADGSHRPEELSRLLDRAADPDAPGLVLGSRWVPGGRVVNWPWHRQLLSRGGNTYVRLLLGVAVRDATGGFRAFRADTLRAIDLAAVESHGYCFQVDMTWRVLRGGGTVAEVPITFVERTVGESKMSRAIVVEALTKVTAWGLAHRGRQLRRLLPGGRRRP
ncbi:MULTISPECIES: polyprenol monophosphomannose synthase [unclassified Isoptericola]|uniref:polyprenol monophosphomannose synthase n=1 Tax=unclassified Isoptericola TaxID=2623355 RepID=UPI00271320B4|nr:MULTISPECIES: polyprenol monophosphomannose synthase [unclassified Isoptericola]MDO8144835.1 polyprenol monophosphomannose synthase [Isoptericola sp. 178]MDO8149615.1 polyprenol monophosphomannose synthase [Isoptericola sp. b515]MDO8152549.1 polyprenol monophosphomannose synthase [Isoptericola sp. b408]